MTGSFVEMLDPDVAVTDELHGEITAAVNLQANAALVGMALLGLGPIHELDTFDPRGDMRRVSLDPGTQFVPLTMLPEVRPVLQVHWEGHRDRRAVNLAHKFDVIGPVQESEIAHVRPGPEASFAVEPHQVAADVIVDHRL